MENILEVELKKYSKSELFHILTREHKKRRLAFQTFLESNANVETIINQIKTLEGEVK